VQGGKGRREGKRKKGGELIMEGFMMRILLGIIR
jgi:hypothetical protein